MSSAARERDRTKALSSKFERRHPAERPRPLADFLACRRQSRRGLRKIVHKAARNCGDHLADLPQEFDFGLEFLRVIRFHKRCRFRRELAS
jgi:hypothetical protein